MLFMSTQAYLIYLAVILVGALVLVIYVSVLIRKKGPSRFDKDIDVAAQEQWAADRQEARIQMRDEP